MISSMTGFAFKQIQTDIGDFTIEIRSVNHRFLDVSFRLPDLFRYLEPELRVIINKELKRGKIEVNLNYVPTIVTDIQINQDKLQQLAGLINAMRVLNLAAVNPLEVLKWPGIIYGAGVDYDKLTLTTLSYFTSTLKELNQNRKKEGTVLSSHILERVSVCENEVKNVRTHASELIALLRQKCLEKIKFLTNGSGLEMDNNRIEQEIVIQAQKADIDEELDRLENHFNEIREIITKGGAIGRRLDFIMQELNREANTLASKAITIATTNAAVELKVLVEQMREQIQNIE